MSHLCHFVVGRPHVVALLWWHAVKSDFLLIWKSCHPYPNKPAFTLPILFPIHPNAALGANMASRHIPHRTHHYSVFSLLSMPWSDLIIIRYCWFFSLLIHNKLDTVLRPLKEHMLCVYVCVWAVSQISFQTGEAFIPRHSCASHPLEMGIFLHANTANETKGFWHGSKDRIVKVGYSEQGMGKKKITEWLASYRYYLHATNQTFRPP